MHHTNLFTSFVTRRVFRQRRCQQSSFHCYKTHTKAQDGKEEQSSASAIPQVLDLRMTILRFLHIVEDLRDCQGWKSWALVILAVPKKESSSLAEAVSSAPAKKRCRFAYQLYVNLEGKFGMLTLRLTIHRFCRNNFLSQKVAILSFIDKDK